MSILFENPGAFVEYENLKRPAANILRDDHPVLLAINYLLTLHAAFKKWRRRRKTLRALADLDDRQLRDIGLTRDDTHYHALAGHEDVQPECLRRRREELHVD